MLYEYRTRFLLMLNELLLTAPCDYVTVSLKSQSLEKMKGEKKNYQIKFLAQMKQFPKQSRSNAKKCDFSSLGQIMGTSF